jgi:alpha-tubulin suppressor-like RCC1 family protein
MIERRTAYPAPANWSRGIAVAALLALAAPAQSMLRGVGEQVFDSEIPELRDVIRVGAGDYHSLAVRQNKPMLAWGDNSFGQCDVPPCPSGLVYTDAAGGTAHSIGLRSDGAVIAWGDNSYGQCNVPSLPPGVTYVEIDAEADMNIARRSDGVVVAWGDNRLGQCNVPPPPPGTNYVQVSTGGDHCIAMCANSAIVAWGDNTFGQSTPPPPIGVTPIKVAAGRYHSVALYTTGSFRGWGHHYAPIIFGVYNSPPGFADLDAGGDFVVARNPTSGVMALVGGGSTYAGTQPPLGVTYTDVAAGLTHAIGCRVDGSVVAWMLGEHGQIGPPARSVGSSFTGISIGDYHNAVVCSDGTLAAWGGTTASAVPALPAGVTYTAAAAGRAFTVALRSDGQAVAFGANYFGQLAVPPLPGGMSYTAIAAGMDHVLALRSDRAVVAWGDNGSGQCIAPPPPPGIDYVAVAAGGDHSAGLRSDGAMVAFGDNRYGQCNVPPPPSGRSYTAMALGDLHTLALLSDGSLAAFGNNWFGQCNVPALPAGLSYVGIAAGTCHSIALRSDGSAVAWGDNSYGQCDVPMPPAGMAIVEVAAARDRTVVRFGPSSSYATFASGCGGSMAPARLVPRELPRLGANLQVTLFDLPLGVAVMLTGLSRTQSSLGALPLPLGAVGMPGCTAYVGDQALTLVLGAAGQARLAISLPNLQALLGRSFYQQAVVLDPAANAFGAVMSDAAAAVIGR